MDTFVPLTCGQCGRGRYVIPQRVSATYRCTKCDHGVTSADIQLDAGDRLAYGATIGLGYVMTGGE